MREKLLRLVSVSATWGKKAKKALEALDCDAVAALVTAQHGKQLKDLSFAKRDRSVAVVCG
jgi:hypothetical protein